MRLRPAEIFVRQGERTSVELRSLASTKADDPDAHRSQMFALYSEARLGFRLARRTWPDHDVATRGLMAASETMIEYLLSAGDVASANTLASQVEGELRPALAARLAAAKDADRTQRRRQAQLEALEQEYNPAIGRRARFGAYALLCAQFLLVQVVGIFYRPLETHAGMIASSAAITALLAVVGVLGHRRLMPTRLNRQLYAFLCLNFVGKLLIHIVIALLGGEARDGHIIAGVLYGCIGAGAAVAYLKPLWPIAIAFMVAAVSSAAFPELSYAFYSGAALFMLVGLYLLYRRESVLD